MKVKLIVVDVFDASYTTNKELKYFVNSDRIDHWKYTTENTDKIIETRFTASEQSVISKLTT